MALKGVERVAVFLTWSLLLLSFVQELGAWSEITDSQFLEIIKGRYTTKPAKTDATTKPPTHVPLLNKSDELEGDKNDYDYYDGSFDDKDDANADRDLKSKSFEPSIPDPYEDGKDENWEDENWEDEKWEDEKWEDEKWEDEKWEDEKWEDEKWEDELWEDEDPTGFHFVCTKNAFKIYLFKKELDQVKVIASKDVLSVEESLKSCGYRENGTLMVPFNGCFARNEKDVYSVQLLLAGGNQVRSATCFGPKSVQNALSPRARPESVLNCPFTSGSPPPPNPTVPASTVPQTLPTMTQSPILDRSCPSSLAERISCGYDGISTEDCETLDCCVDPESLSCFYPENECTKDGYFLFTIRHDSASVRVNTAMLEMPGTDCQPNISTEYFAVFKFHKEKCGTHTFSIDSTKVYLAEVQTIIERLNLKFGAISRSTQVRFLIECRYSSESESLASAGYMVTTHIFNVPPAVISDGLYGVVLKIAKDDTYTDFYPMGALPLRVLLGKTVYLQLVLLSPVPDAVIRVHQCAAYPRISRKALVLIYEGCSNPHDRRVLLRPNSDFNGDRNERRFEVDAFQFVDVDSNLYINEVIYFMCTVSLCFSYEEPCEERCFDGSVPQTKKNKKI